MRKTPNGRCGLVWTSWRSWRSCETRAKEPLRVRIGIATGIVVVGDLVGQGSAQEQAVVGDTPNLAARLQALAEPGSVVIAEATRRLLGGTFELKALGPFRSLKGFDAPVPVWSVVARGRERQPLRGVAVAGHDAVRRARARGRAAAGPLARRERGRGPGRAASRARRASASRAFCRRCASGSADEPHITMRYQCSPHHVNDAFYPITSQIWHAAGFVSGEPAAARLDKLEAMIARSGLDAEGDRAVPRRAAVDPLRGSIPRARNGPERAEGADDRGADRRCSSG